MRAKARLQENSYQKSKIAILNIGQELLDGRTVNTNASYFAEVLHAHAFVVEEVRCIPDIANEIIQGLLDFSKYSFVIVTGGLGPTSDDITAATAAKAFQDKLVLLPKAKQSIQKMLARVQRNYSKEQERQAILPARAKVLPNNWGIAPGFSYCWQQKEKKVETQYFFFPGVPRECRPMFVEYCLPVLEKSKRDIQKLAGFTWRCFGMRESDVNKKLQSIIDQAQVKWGENFQFSSQIPYPLVDIRMEFWSGRDSSAKSPTEKEYKKIYFEVKKKLGEIVYSENEKSTLPEEILLILKKYRYTLVTAESCTGGWIGKMITDIPGSSEFYLGGAISYVNSAKEIFLNVEPSLIKKYGAVSKQVACAMAEGIRSKLRADCAIAVTGISGPGGGTETKPVGTVFISIAGPWGTDCEHHVIKTLLSSREQNRNYASHLALDMLRKKMLAQE